MKRLPIIYRVTNSSISAMSTFILVFTGAVMAAMMSPPVQAASDDVCEGVPIKQRISRLGGPNSFSEGAVAGSVAELESLFARYQGDLRQVLESQGMAEVADPLFNAIASRQGITEGTVAPGDRFQWMAWRKRGEPTTTSPVCLATDRTYESFEIQVQSEGANEISTHTFSVPKICLNLALVGTQTAAKPAPAPAPVPEPEPAAPAPAPEAAAPVEDERRWTLRPFFAYVNPSDDIKQSRVRPNGVSEQSTLSFGGGAGAGISAEYHFTDRLGLEVAAIIAELDSRFMFDLDEAWETDTDDISFTALTIGPNFHLTNNSEKVDLYVGPFVGFVDLGNSSYQTLGESVRRSFDDDFVVGVQVGADIPIVKSSPWKLHTGLRYIDFTADEDRTGDDADIDPLIFTIGAARSF